MTSELCGNVFLVIRSSHRKSIRDGAYVQAACPPTWLIGGFAGVMDESVNGILGEWDMKAAPVVAHFVGAPIKAQSMKHAGMWNYDGDALAAWTRDAVAEIDAVWKGKEDAQAAQDPFEPATAARLLQEGQRVRAKLPKLDAYRDRCRA